MAIQAPEWKVPDNLREIVNQEEVWESDAWHPIQLSVWGGTEYKGRPIELSWQIEFDPEDDSVRPAGEQLQSMGVEPNGYGWATLINSVIEKYHPEIADEVQFGDTEEAACVVWVESEQSCRTLIQVAWNLISTKA
jgi:hypothetical protein